MSSAEGHWQTPPMHVAPLQGPSHAQFSSLSWFNAGAQASPPSRPPSVTPEDPKQGLSGVEGSQQSPLKQISPAAQTAPAGGLQPQSSGVLDLRQDNDSELAVSEEVMWLDAHHRVSAPHQYFGFEVGPVPRSRISAAISAPPATASTSPAPSTPYPS